jgi:hypothetical protein
VAGEEDNRFNTAPWYKRLAHRQSWDGTLTVQDTGLPVFMPFRMSSFVLSNLVVTAGMLTPGLGVGLAAIGNKALLRRSRRQGPWDGKSPTSR